MSHSRELLIDGAKASPVVAVGLAHWMAGITLEQWVSAVTLLYVVCLAVEKLYKGWQWLRAKRGPA